MEFNIGPANIPTYVALPSWSPDSKSMAFARNVDNLAQIVTIDFDGKNMKQLTTDGNTEAALWSPDGKHIAYFTVTDSPRGARRAVYVVDVDGNNKRLLTTNDMKPIDTYSGWTPDGQHILIGGPEMKFVIFGLDGTPTAHFSVSGDLSPDRSLSAQSKWVAQGISEVVATSIQTNEPWKSVRLNADLWPLSWSPQFKK
jgi:hypothetical protein